MRFNQLQAIACGNAIRLMVQPTAGESRWRVLRKEANDFSGADDPSAFLVHDGADQFVTDARLLVNGVTYYYAVFGYTSGAWGVPVVASAVPSSNFKDVSVDALELVRERIDVTLHAMIARGLAALSTPTIPVMSIPFYTQGGTLPVVTVLYGGSQAVSHGIGEQVGWDEHEGSRWFEPHGWHESTSIEISAWSLNAEERNSLRVALKAVIAANLGVLEDQGLNMVEVQSVQDSEDMQSMNVPIYQTVFRLGYQSVVAVTDEFGSFVDFYPSLGA